MHGIRHQGLVYKEVVEAHQIIKNLTTGDLGIPFVVIRAGVSGLKKCRLVHLPDLFEGGRDKGHYDLVCGAPLDDWANGGYVDVLFKCGENGFSSLQSWSCSEERVWNLLTKRMLDCFREVRCQQADTPGI